MSSERQREILTLIFCDIELLYSSKVTASNSSMSKFPTLQKEGDSLGASTVLSEEDLCTHALNGEQERT